MIAHKYICKIYKYKNYKHTDLKRTKHCSSKRMDTFIKY